MRREASTIRKTFFLAAAILLAAVAVAPPAAAAGPLELMALQRESRWLKLRGWLGGGELLSEPLTMPIYSEAQMLGLGGRAYAMYCINCHGPQGRGDGPRAALLEPPPRDLSSGRFKFRSTPSGSAPMREDLFRTISGGLRGTAMLPFADLPEIERWALVAWVRHLAGEEADSEPARPLEVGAVPGDLTSSERIGRGAALYEKLQCKSCHGPKGRGDGPAAAALVDAKGRKLAPPDFATRPLKRGERPEALYLTLATGLDGSAMPGYMESAKSDELWDLAAFVNSLRQVGSLEADAREIAAAEASLAYQHRQGSHAVISGCGCRAKRRRANEPAPGEP